ncbi:probable 28S ribosomal protein S23, mitochondrial [Wyeomyia smithii]|uniref:probable 28S ribosomal protein S23, mitochondrial n=1 Tax=Wyeomyia smithii TaxID=174621 RepID=UPI002467D740|nr:probable 28S ribosomal protein S23, mitochondrial [Wyeomyia smithii]
MAHSRLEKIGTILTRTQGLLRSGAMKWDDRPLWYDVVVAFPPKEEPRYDRPAPNVPLRSIFYAEDKIRAIYHHNSRPKYTVNLADQHSKTATQLFIDIYKNLDTQGALDQERVLEAALEMLEEKMKLQKSVQNAGGAERSYMEQIPSKSTPNVGKTVQLQDIFND